MIRLAEPPVSSQYRRTSGVLPTRPLVLTNPTVKESNMADCADSVFPCDVNSGERWLPVPGYEGLYEVSDYGRVRSLDRIVVVRGRIDGQTSKRVKGRVLKPGLSAGRPVVNLRSDIDGRHAMVHHLVLEAFVGACPEGQECRHLNDNRQDNRLANLVWGTRRENMADRRRNGLRKRGVRGENNNASKLTNFDVQEIRRLRASGLSFEKVASRFGVSWQTVRRIVKGEAWGWLE